MGIIQLDCPHVGCRTRNTAFQTLYVKPNTGQNSFGQMFAVCQVCNGGIVMAILSRTNRVQDTVGLDHGQFFDQIKLVEMFPKPAESEAPKHLPSNVEKVFLEACDNLNDGRLTSAAGMLRSTLDRMVRDVDPGGNGTLYKRIEALQESQGLPQPLIDLMHQVRFLGNEIHDEDDPDQVDVDRGKQFAKLILTYVYELPGDIELNNEKRNGQAE